MKKPFNLKSKIVAQLRKLFAWSPWRRDILKAAISNDSFECAICHKNYHKLLAKVDHKEPVVDPKVGFQSFDIYIDRLFCPMENLQVCCVECHKYKTKEEDKLRKLYKTGKSSVAHIKALSDMRKGLAQTPAREAVRRRMVKDREKPVIVEKVDSGVLEEFPSVSAASIALNIEACNISRVCNGRQGRMQVEGYKCWWKKGAK